MKIMGRYNEIKIWRGTLIRNHNRTMTIMENLKRQAILHGIGTLLWQNLQKG